MAIFRPSLSMLNLLLSVVYFFSIFSSSFSFPSNKETSFNSISNTVCIFFSPMDLFFLSHYSSFSWYHHLPFLIERYLLPWSNYLFLWCSFILTYFKISLTFFVSWFKFHRSTFWKLLIPLSFFCTLAYTLSWIAFCSSVRSLLVL